MKSLRRRLDRLALQLPARRHVEDTPELRRQWCIEHGVDEDSELLGWESGAGIIVLPREREGSADCFAEHLAEQARVDALHEHAEADGGGDP
jgi:hypothetical protein